VQQGSVILTGRKHGPDVWQFRWSEKDRSGRRIYHKRVIGTVQQYPDAQAAREVTTALVGHINAGASGCKISDEFLAILSAVCTLLFLLEDSAANLVIRIDLKQVNAASSALTIWLLG